MIVVLARYLPKLMTLHPPQHGSEVSHRDILVALQQLLRCRALLHLA
jgi:hypothetical protein